jgi:hypothetical protein
MISFGFTKEEEQKLINEQQQQLKKVNRCATKKCGKLAGSKELRKASNLLTKEQDTKCPEKAINGFNDNDCLDKVYTKSNFSRIMKKHRQCTKKKCSKERKTLKKLRKQLGRVVL